MDERVQERYGAYMECPHCGRRQSDPWEIEKDSGTTECETCENQFHYSRHQPVTYTTWLVP